MLWRKIISSLKFLWFLSSFKRIWLFFLIEIITWHGTEKSVFINFHFLSCLRCFMITSIMLEMMGRCLSYLPLGPFWPIFSTPVYHALSPWEKDISLVCPPLLLENSTFFLERNKKNLTLNSSLHFTLLKALMVLGY